MRSFAWASWKANRIDTTWKQAWMVAFGQHANLDADAVDAARSVPAASEEDAAQVVHADFHRKITA
ncbi:hypothetical protein [Actinoallomurus bryophytorum]|uniref:hypothetical protein n=1 Tax=Actinoallomurus bryophytorum TaxID=1490222 RepID=UPI001152DD3F|nr:hypothetical protein [Actinoallomurus bryophytorum]